MTPGGMVVRVTPSHTTDNQETGDNPVQRRVRLWFSPSVWAVIDTCALQDGVKDSDVIITIVQQVIDNAKRAK